MPVLQGFKEVSLALPQPKVVMTVTESYVRFNKGVVTSLGTPAYVRVLVNDKDRQVALEVCSGREANALRFAKEDGAPTVSVTIREPAVLDAVLRYFKLKDSPEGEVSYQLVNGIVIPGAKAVVFDADEAVDGMMKRRGRKKAE